MKKESSGHDLQWSSEQPTVFQSCRENAVGAENLQMRILPLNHQRSLESSNGKNSEIIDLVQFPA